MSIVTKNALRVLATALSFPTIAATPSVVLAQQGLLAVCAPDIQAQCAGHTAEGRRACIKTRFKDFSLPCQLALVKTRAVGKACRADVKKHCASITPGGGRIAESGTPPHIVEAILNHVSGHKAGVAGIYNRADYSDAKRIALRKWSDHLEALVSGKRSSKVVKLHG